MWKVVAYLGNDLVLEHKQPDYLKCFQVAINSIMEMANKNVQDYRIVLMDRNGTEFLYAVGEKTNIVGRKVHDSTLEKVKHEENSR